MATASDRLTGRLLVADPQLVDPNFRRTVVLLLAHNDDGALGLVLNRPDELTVEQVASRWADRSANPRVLFTGGPVESDALIALGRAADAAGRPAGGDVLDGVGVVDLTAELDPEEDRRVGAVRIFRGYAGWSPSQLEDEIGRGDWHLVDADPDDVFTADPTALWRTVLRRQPGPLAALATYPEHPWLN